MKAKFVKKCLSMLLLVVMLVTLFPVNIMATEQQNDNQETMGLSADITAPTDVSVVSFVENGQTVRNGDDIHFIITAQDTESEISAEKSVVYINGSSENGTSIKAVEGQANTYEISFGGSFFVKDGLNEINRITISDAAGNATTLDLVDENGNALYTFYGDFKEVDATITDIAADITEIALDDTTTNVEVNITAKTDYIFTGSQTPTLYLIFVKEEAPSSELYFSLGYDAAQGCFKGTENFTSRAKEGNYILETAELSCYIDGQWGEQMIEVSASSIPVFSITKNFSDIEGPILEEFYFTKNGEKVENGFSVTAEDELKLYCGFNEEVRGWVDREFLSLQLGTDQTGLPIGEIFQDFDFSWNDELKLHEVVIDVSALYPTEWRFFIQVFDRYGNCLSEDSSNKLFKQYFYVLKDGTCTVPEYECDVVIENGDITTTNTITVQRMTTWKELLPDGLPAPAEKDGEKCIGWTYRMDTKNTEGEWRTLLDDAVIDLREERGFEDADGSVMFGGMEPTIYIKPVYEKTGTTTPGMPPESDTTPTPAPEVAPTPDKVVELDAVIIEKTVETILATQAGKEITIDMSKSDGTIATVIPAEILEAARENHVDIVLDMGSYSWSINSNDILNGNLSDINLEVTMDTNAIPSATVNALANGDKTRQLSLTHNGDFGFKASLTIEVGTEYEGKFGNLYYHDSTGKLVFMNAGKIQKDGTVTVDFSHASDYVIVIGDDRTENQSDITPIVPPANASVESPKTGEVQSMVCILFIVLVVVFGRKVVKIKQE